MTTTGKKTKGKNFRAAELDRMLALVESCLPFGSEQWVSVASAYNARLPSGWPERDGESLRRKFMSLKDKRKPTGDPDCPSEVKRAKITFRKIEARCAVSSLNDDDSEEVELEPEEGPGSEGSGDAGYGLEAFANELDGAGGATATDGEQEAGFTTPQQVAVAEEISTPSPPQVASSRVATPTTATLTASARAGLTPTQLAQLSSSISRANEDGIATTTLLSQTAQRRIRLDKLMEKVASDALPGNRGAETNLFGVMMMMEERQAAREVEARREREREAARESLERQFQLELAQSQSARDAQNHQLMMLVMAKAFGVPPPSNSDE